MTIDLRSVARALGGEVSGRQVIAPGPGHSRTDRSLAVRLDPCAPDGFLTHSFTNDDWQTCRDHVRTRLGLPQWEPGDGREKQRTVRPQDIDKWDFGVVDTEAEDRTRSEDDLVRIRQAQTIWEEASHTIWTKAENYFASRKIDIPDDLAETVLRFHPECPWRNESTGKTDRIPCLIAAFRSIDDDIITAIHRIRLDQPERWPKTERRMLGVTRRSAVKLGPSGSRLTIGEGIETCLAAMRLGLGLGLGLGPAWALGSVGAISFFPLIEGVQELTILAEAGEPSARAIKICGRRWRRGSRRVFVSRSNVGSDHNDALMQAAQ
jgi:putative DNA primase/helicase